VQDAKSASFITGIWGITLLHATISGQVAAFFHPIFQPIIFVAAIILLLLSFLLLLYSLPDTPGLSYPYDSEGQETFRFATQTHSTRYPTYRALVRHLVLVFLLTAPPVALKIFAPDSFSETVIQNRALPNAADIWRRSASINFSDLVNIWNNISRDEIISTDVREILLAGGDENGRIILEGRRIELLGQTQPLTSNTFRISRFLMLCCAADAVPISVVAQGELPSQSSWHKIIGRLYYEPIPEDLRNQVPEGFLPWEPKIEVENITPIPTPRQPFLY
jgi:uncharacterized membrane protein YcgQ (UPF0703/DUF1980 family)